MERLEFIILETLLQMFDLTCDMYHISSFSYLLKVHYTCTAGIPSLNSTVVIHCPSPFRHLKPLSNYCLSEAGFPRT